MSKETILTISYWFDSGLSSVSKDAASEKARRVLVSHKGGLERAGISVATRSGLNYIEFVLTGGFTSGLTVNAAQRVASLVASLEELVNARVTATYKGTKIPLVNLRNWLITSK